MNPEIKNAVERILASLQEKGSTLNFIHLDDWKFRNESEKFAAIKYLEGNGYIVKAQKALGQNYQITPKGSELLLRIYADKVLLYLYEHDGNTFTQVSEVLKTLTIPDKDDERAELIKKILMKEDWVFAVEEGGVQLNENGKERVIEQKFGITEPIHREGINQNTKPQTESNKSSAFSDEEQETLNAKIDSILEELKTLKAGQEVIWADLMKELSELKDLYFLSKKTWRQLLTGKLAEMVAGRIITETVSKRIADSINPTIANLLP